MASAGNAKKVYALAASTAPSSSDEIDGISDCTVNENRELEETTDYKGNEFKTRIALLRDVSISMSGDEELADTPQNLIRSSLASGATIHITVLSDGTNGYTYPCLVESYERGGAVNGKNTFSANFVLNGTPIARP